MWGGWPYCFLFVVCWRHTSLECLLHLDTFTFIVYRAVFLDFLLYAGDVFRILCVETFMFTLCEYFYVFYVCRYFFTINCVVCTDIYFIFVVHRNEYLQYLRYLLYIKWLSSVYPKSVIYENDYIQYLQYLSYAETSLFVCVGTLHIIRQKQV